MGQFFQTPLQNERTVSYSPAETRKIMLAIDYPILQTTQKQACLALLDQLSHVSAALREVQEQRYLLFQQQQALYEQQYILDPTFSQRLSPLLKEYTAILGQLACLRADK